MSFSVTKEKGIETFKGHLHGELLKTQSCIARAVNKLTSGKEKSGNFPKDLEAESQVRFKPRVFLKEFIYNITNCTPLVMIIEGYNGACNRSFWGLRALPQAFIWLSIAAVNVIYGMYQPKDINVFEIIIMDLIFIIRTAVIATKYAYMSEPDLKVYSHKRLTTKDIESKQVISSWAYMPDDIIERQLLYAAVRQKHDLNQYVFEVPERNEEMYEDEFLYAQKFGTWNVGMEIIKSANRSETTKLPIFAFALAILHTFFPIIIRSAQGKMPFGGESWSEWPAYVVSIGALYPGWFLTYSNLYFLSVAVVEFRRKFYISTSLDMVLSHSIVRTEEKKSKKKKERREIEQSTPELSDVDGHIRLVSPLKDVVIDLSHPQNVSAWFILRQVLLDYGRTFSRRIAIFTGYFSIYILFLVLFLLIQVLLFTSQNPVITVIVIYDTIIFAVMLILMVLPGGRVNDVNRIHVFNILQRKLDSLQYSGQETDSQRLALLQATSILIDTCVNYMRSYNTRNKVKIIGFEAGGQMAGAFLAVAASGLAAGIRSIYNAVQ